MDTNPKSHSLPFGTVLGYTLGNIPAYSSDYKSADPIQMPDRHSYRHYVNGIYTGYKWQCVEFARRWLLLNKGHVFADIAMAYDIFRLTYVTEIESGIKLPLHAFENGSQRRPEPGCMLIWNEGGEFDVTGHVAIITEVFDDRIRIAEQNLDHQLWKEGCNYSRELPASISEDGSYWIQCSFQNASILGWVIQTEDDRHAVKFAEKDPALFQIKLKELELKDFHLKAWMNTANPDEAAYVAMNGYKLSNIQSDQYKYFCISQTAQAELKRATNELHAMFMHAIDFVLQNDKYLKKFNIPEIIWPRIHQSWDNRKNQMITGRFDFCMTEAGLKVYEYNADSASCHMECGKIQGMWAKHFHCEEGEDAGGSLFESLAEAWRKNEIEGIVHIMLDREQEETYHALFMKSIMESVGIECKLIHGIEGLLWSNDGRVLDNDGVPIEKVWKTWAWETALDQLRAEMDEAGQMAALNGSKHALPRLMDVLFQPKTIVFEPLWTLIPSNKAILPILWQIFPEHPYLLNTQYHLTSELQNKGYVMKPIAGRCGLNISLFDMQNLIINETNGDFHHQSQIYQELYKLPNINGYNVQLCTFSAAGSYCGACARTDASLIITKQSELMPLRIVNDKLFLM